MTWTALQSGEATTAIHPGVRVRTTFLASDIRRAVRAIESAGKPVAAVDFLQDGGFRVLIGEPSAPTVLSTGSKNEWDSVLPG